MEFTSEKMPLFRFKTEDNASIPAYYGIVFLIIV